MAQHQMIMKTHSLPANSAKPLPPGRRERSVGCDEERFISPEESRLRAFGWGEALIRVVRGIGLAIISLALM